MWTATIKSHGRQGSADSRSRPSLEEASVNADPSRRPVTRLQVLSPALFLQSLICLRVDFCAALQYTAAVSFLEAYERAIRAIVAACPAPDKFAHMCAGLGFWLAAALIWRKPLASFKPMLVVVVLECANEVADYLAKGGWFWSDTLVDAAATWTWPLVLTLALRFVPALSPSRPISHTSVAIPVSDNLPG